MPYIKFFFFVYCFDDSNLTKIVFLHLFFIYRCRKNDILYRGTDGVEICVRNLLPSPQPECISYVVGIENHGYIESEKSRVKGM